MKKHIIIIGGGISGLSAGNVLVRNDYAVTLLEARERLGGRIHTIRDGELPVELGAEFLHGESKTIRAVIEAAGLSTHHVPDRYQLLEDGKLKRVKFWDKMIKIIHQIDPLQPDCSFQDFLDQQKLKPRDRAQVIGFVQGFHAAHTDKISAHSLLRGEFAAEQMQGDTQSRINEGYSALVGFTETEIENHGAKILKNAVVQSIHWKRKEVEIAFRHDNELQYLEANAAIITLPLGVLKSTQIKFDPPLVEKQEAIIQLQFGNVIKVILIFRERWWPRNFSFIQTLEEPIPTWWTDPRGFVLTGWAGGPKADALAHRSHPELEKLALEILSRIFPENQAAAREQLVRSHSFDWANDPHARGAYSYLPVNGLDLPKLLAAPVNDTLFFAGEATVDDAQTGTVFGAYESGLRAAREVLAMAK